MKYIWLIVSKSSNYVHCAFTELKDADKWVEEYEKRSDTPGKYHVIGRPLFDYFNPNE